MKTDVILWQFLALLAVHWFADFVLQTHWQASNKSKNLEALCRHVSTYSAVLAVASFILFGFSLNVLAFVLLNNFLHLGTDYLTSRWSARLWAAKDWHNFFVVIGFDQLIHQATLAASLWWLL